MRVSRARSSDDANSVESSRKFLFEFVKYKMLTRKSEKNTRSAFDFLHNPLPHDFLHNPTFHYATTFFCCLQVSYETSLREAKRALDEHSEKLQSGSVAVAKHNSVAARVSMLLSRMSNDLSKECERQGAWGVVGKGTGARLVQNGQPLSRNQIIGTDGSVKVTSLVTHDKVTGLLVPTSSAKMQLGNGDIVAVPNDFFVHPQTGRVMPIQGNVAFDTNASKLVVIVDSATGAHFTTFNLCLAHVFQLLSLLQERSVPVPTDSYPTCLSLATNRRAPP